MAKHRLVTIGDSITQGVRSGAAVDGQLSWPMFLARALGVADTFRTPTVASAAYGLPINLEQLVDDVLARYGDALGLLELPAAALRVRSWMDRLEDHWEEGTTGLPDHDGPFHNLGILGFDLRDALSLTAAECDRRIPARRQRDELISQIPEAAGHRVARSVLAGSAPDNTVFDIARDFAADGGIEVLVVMLGANNALQVASELELFWTGADYDDLDGKAKYTLWQPQHFAAEYAGVVEAAAAVGAEHTVLATVPKVTIAPLARGVGDKMAEGSRYFEYYTRVWIDDDDFDPRQDDHITHRDARDADQAIDTYNETIRAAAEANGWILFDLSSLLDSLATRRYVDDPAARPVGWTGYAWPSPLDDLDPVLGTRFFESENGRRVAGGIFSLDGIHPTVVASALIAHELAVLLAENGVQVGRVDLQAALDADRLNSHPPEIVDSVLDILGWLDQLADVIGAITHPFRTDA